MEPLKSNSNFPELPPVNEAPNSATFKGRRYSLTHYKPHEKLFLNHFAKMLYEDRTQPFAPKAKLLSDQEVKDIPSPTKKEEKTPVFRRMKADEVAAKGEHIKELLAKFKKGFPEEPDFATKMMYIFLESETEEKFIQNTLTLSNLPKEKILEQLFVYCANNRDLLDALKKEYGDYQKNYKSSLKIAFQLHEEFLKVYGHEGPAYDAANGVVVLSHNQLEFAKSLANKYFPQMLSLGWTPQLERQNASLIQAIVVGDNILNTKDSAVFLPKSPACFVLKETREKELPGTPKELNPGISYSFNHFINFKNDLDELITKDSTFTIERLEDLFRSVMSAFTKDSLKRQGMHLVSGNVKLALGTSLKDRPLLATVLYNQFIQYIKNNPHEFPKMIHELVNSPLLKALKKAFPECFHEEAIVKNKKNGEGSSVLGSLKENFPETSIENTIAGQTIFPREAFLQLIQKEIAKNHSEKMDPQQIVIEKELIALIKSTEITPETLKQLNFMPEDAIQEKRLLLDFQALIQHKFLEVFTLINQAFFAPMIKPLSWVLFSETVPFFPVPTYKEYNFGNGLNSFSVSLTSDIATPSLSNDPNGVYDRFNEMPIVAQITIHTTVPSISAQEHSSENRPVSNSLKDLRVAWTAPKSVVQTLISKVIPDVKSTEVVNAEELLKNDLFKQLDLLSTLKPGDDLVVDDLGVHLYPINVNTVRPYANFILSKLPTTVSGKITQYSGYSNENQYNPKAEEQLERFTEKLDKALKLYVEQAIAQGKDYNEINEFIADQVSKKLARVHLALQDWGQVNRLILPKGKYYQMVTELASFYLIPTNIAD